jgi:hypothetical protein
LEKSGFPPHLRQPFTRRKLPPKIPPYPADIRGGMIFPFIFNMLSSDQSGTGNVKGPDVDIGAL